jgi:hypothetical protein
MDGDTFIGESQGWNLNVVVCRLPVLILLTEYRMEVSDLSDASEI